MESADPVFEALGLCQGVANEDTQQYQPGWNNQMQMQMQQQMQLQGQIQQQVMYAVQQHVQQQIQQSESGTQDAAFKNPEAISAFAAAATTAALVYCQSLQAAPMVPEVPMAGPYAAWGPSGWQMPWYPNGPYAGEAAPVAPQKEEVPCTPRKETGEQNSDGVTPSPVQHLNFGATPSDYGTAGPYATLSPMILKLSEVVTDCQSPTTASDRPSTGCEQSEAQEENAGAMLLQLLKGGAKEESSRPAEGHITPSTASEEGFGDSQRQALASSGQELLRQLRQGSEAKGTTGKTTHVRRAKNGEVRVLQI